DGKRVAVDRKGAIAWTDSVHAMSVGKAVASPDGSVVVASADGSIYLSRCVAPATAPAPCSSRPIASGYAKSLALNAEHSLVAIGFEDGTLKIIAFGDDPFEADNHLAGPIAALAWSHDGAYLAAGTTNGRLLITDMRGRVLTEGSGVGASVSALAWSPKAS